MATVNDYKDALQRATAAGDDEAIAHFQSQIDKGLAQPTNADGNPIPQGGSILNPVSQGLTFGFMDELAGLGGGLASSAINAFPETIDKGLNLFGRHLNVDPSKEGFNKGYDTVAGDIRQGNEEYAARHPYVNAAAEIGSGLAMPFGLIRSGTSGLRTAAGAGAAYGAGKADGDLVERAKGAATGAAAGGVGYGALRALSGLGRAIFPAVSAKASGPGFQEAVRELRGNGIQVTPSEQIGSKAGRMAEDMTSKYWGQPSTIEGRPQQLTSRLMRWAGFHPEDVRLGELTDDAVNRASQRFNQRYDRVLRGVQVDLPNMAPRLQQMRAAYAGEFGPQQMPRLNRIFREFEQQIGSGRAISGEQYKRIYSWLGKQSRAAARPNSPDSAAAPVFQALRSNLSDAFRTAVPRARMDALRAVDRDYAGYKYLQEWAKNPDAIGTMVNKVRNGVRPRREFERLAKAYQTVLLRGEAKSSGTAENQVTKQLMPPFASMIRATGARGTAGAQNLGLGVPNAVRGVPSFIAGEQAPDSDLEDLVKMLAGTDK